ncbi:class I SAM-dependent methyltransferase [Chloroflexota bacterium]
MGKRIQTFAHREAVGGMWDEIGTLQFEYVVNEGLKPHHKMLDIGCGSLRGGVHFIRYLNSGNYYGIDRSESLLGAARHVELPRYGLADRTVHLECRSDFAFAVFGVQFDYVVAQSVFTHLTWNSILRCLVNVEKVLHQDGRFYATFFEDPSGAHRIHTIAHEPGGKVTYPDQDPYHYEFGVLEELARRASLRVSYVGNWNHPRNQMLMVFTRQ